MSNIIKFEELEAKLISYHDKFPDGYILELTKVRNKRWSKILTTSIKKNKED